MYFKFPNCHIVCLIELPRSKRCFGGDSQSELIELTLYDPGFNFGATLLCVGDFSQKIV